MQKGWGKREARRRGGEERETNGQHNDLENSGLPDLTYGSELGVWKNEMNKKDI